MATFSPETSSTQSSEHSTDRGLLHTRERSQSFNEPNIQKPSWRALLAFTAKDHLVVLYLSITLAVGSGLVQPGFAVLLGKIFDQFADFGGGKIGGQEFRSTIAKYALTVTALGLGSWLINACFFFSWLAFGELQAMVSHSKIFQGLVEKSSGWYDLRRSGVRAMIPRLQSQIRELQLSTSQPLGYVTQYVVTGVASLIIAFYYCWNLTLVILATVPVSAVFLSWMSRRMQPHIVAQQKDLSDASRTATNAFQNIETVKCFNSQETEISKFFKIIQRAAVEYMRQANNNAAQIGFLRFITLSMFVQGFWYGHHLVSSGSNTTGTVITTFWSCLTATQAIEEVMPHMIVLEKGRAAGLALRTLLVHKEAEGLGLGKVAKTLPSVCRGEIKIQNVSFAYPIRPNHLVLDSFTGTFIAGQFTFIIGRSGSGKSTIGQILMRFYNPSRGSIYLDGQDLAGLDTSWLRRNVTLVEQSSVLFDGTMFDNIALGQKSPALASVAEVRLAAEFALLQETISELPKGIDTTLGAKGVGLSGGQRQRVALARARLRDTPILILDESTSALDHVTRALILSAIRSWRKGKTTLVVSHDMTQVQDDDYVFILKDGRLVQEGYGAELDQVAQSKNQFYEEQKHSSEDYQDISKSTPRSPNTALDSNGINNIFADPPSRTGLRSIPSVFAEQQTSFRSARASMSFGTPLATASSFFDSHSSPSSESAGMSRRAGHAQSLRSKNRTGPSDPPVPQEPLPRQISRENKSRRMSEDAIELMEYTGLNAVQNRLSAGGRGRRAPLRSFSSPTSPISPGSPVPLLNGASESEDTEYDVQDTLPEAVSLSMKEILMTVWPHLNHANRLQCVLGFLGAVVHAVATPLFSWIFSKLLSTFFSVKNGDSKALKWSVSILAVAFVEAIACFSMHSLLESCSQTWVNNIRHKAINCILNQPKSFFSEEPNKIARLVQSLDRDAEEMRNILGRFAAFLLIALVMMSLAVIWSMSVCWKLTLVGLSITPFSYVITRSFQSISAIMEAKSNAAAEACADVLNETFTKIKIVRALTLEDHFHFKHARATATALKVGLRRAVYCGFFYGISEATVLFTCALIFYYGALLATEHEFSINDILLVFSMLLFSLSNLTAIVAFIPQIQSSKDTASRLLHLANLPQYTHEREGDLDIREVGDIQCTSLTFAYNPRDPASQVLHGVNVTFPAGRSTAIVGPSGSGKSTIASLLLRLYPIPSSHQTVLAHDYDPSLPSLSSSAASWPLPARAPPAQITLSDPPIPISRISTPNLRAHIAIVPQTPVLFSATVAQNILYPSPSSSQQSSHDLESAARAAGIHDFIMSLPHGYDTLIGDGGLGLSGGQVQRLAIARALAKKPQVLVLDEATSALDPASAGVVRDTVRNLMRDGGPSGGSGSGDDQAGETKKKGMTVLMITHSREMMEMCDNVVVMEAGKVVETGGFEELMQRGKGARLRHLLSGGEWAR